MRNTPIALLIAITCFAADPPPPPFQPYRLDGLNSAVLDKAQPPYYAVRYEPSDKPGELKMPVTFRVWIPPGVAKLRGVLVHQHGCGNGAGQNGATAAYDWHWQALAKKWDMALLGPSYEMLDGQLCKLWCDPRNGSDKAFVQALKDLGAKSGHAELSEIPWALWGHSGGGTWASLMQMLYPERIAAIWFRSGTALMLWEVGELPKPEMPNAAWEIPMGFNVGEKELLPTTEVARQRLTWRQAFEFYRRRGALISWVLDPLSGHECLDSRYAAIAFFNSALAARLPEAGGALRSVNHQAAWLSEAGTPVARPATAFKGAIDTASWLADGAFAKAWMRYSKTGAPFDDTPPPAPSNVRVDAGRTITWQCDVDFESGIAGFIIERDGKEIARLPEKPVGKFGAPLFQGMTHGDTPVLAAPLMQFTDRTASGNHDYRVIAINAAGLRSK